MNTNELTDRSTMLQRQDLFDFYTHPGTLDDYLNLIRQSISTQQNCTIFNHNLHSLYCYLRSETLRDYYEGTTVLVDGMGLVMLYRLAGIPVTRDQRVTFVDFIMPMMRLARDNGWRVYHVGQHSDILHRALEKIRHEIPGIEIDGHDGFFDLTPCCPDSNGVIQRINDFSADLVLIGFGTPKQEAWIHAHRDKIDAAVLLSCGACMEYVAGAVKTPPRWMGKAGLEWSFRLIENPRRFAFRYMLEPFMLVAMLSRSWIRQRFSGHRDHS